MDCPRCAPKAGEATAYRGAVPRGSVAPLVTEPHESGVSVARCASCHGVFATNEDLVQIENWARRTRSFRRGDFRRAFDPPTDAMSCPSCHGETTRREWSIGTLVFVDVCVECRGVWLDTGELEALTGERAR